MPVVDTKYGKLEGTSEDGVDVFRGVRFAAPPLGALRFQAPQPPESWTGVQPATEFGHTSPQGVLQIGDLPFADAEFANEDCLFLNVWTPACDDRRRPVLVWIHGGAFLYGSGSTPWYWGDALAKRGDVVVVTINYRLGALGFLNLDGLLPATANAGMLDQAAALRWVKDNIAAFGGDPGNVTIFGESAGGMSVGTLLGMPAAQGLFQRAIPQSGAAHNALTAAEASGVARALLDKLGIATEEAAKLREVPVADIVSAQEAVNLQYSATPAASESGGQMLPFQPCVDGSTLPRLAVDAVADGFTKEVSVLIGTTRDEAKLFLIMNPAISSMDDAGLLAAFQISTPRGKGEELLNAYRAARPNASVTDIYGARQTDHTFRIPAIRLMEARLKHNPAVYSYLFTAESPTPGLGACHAIEIPFVFGTLGKAGAAQFSGSGPGAEALSEKVMDAWIAFARTGNPATASLPAWPAYDTATRSTMLLGPECKVVQDYGSAEREAWTGVL
jgi:para-nitrobenzyl esterase